MCYHLLSVFFFLNFQESGIWSLIYRINAKIKDYETNIPHLIWHTMKKSEY